MKKILAILCAAALAFTLTACSSLESKSVITETNGSIIKGSVSDPSTGSFVPTVIIGLYNFLFLDHKNDDGDLIYYRSQSAMLNSSAVTTTFVSIKQGMAAKITVPPDSLVSLPGLKVVSGASTVNISIPAAGSNSDSGK